MYIWETGCKTSTSTINKTMNEKNEYNKHAYTKRERERERERERAKEHVVKKKYIFYNWAELVYTFFKKFNSYSFYKDWLINALFMKKTKAITFRILLK